MDNNNNKDVIEKLEREIWLFEQWLAAIENQSGETQKRIKVAYQECISSRKAKLYEIEQCARAEQIKSRDSECKDASIA